MSSNNKRDDVLPNPSMTFTERGIISGAMADRMKEDKVDIPSFWDQVFRTEKWKKWKSFLFESMVISAAIKNKEHITRPQDQYKPTGALYIFEVRYFDCSSTSFQWFKTGIHHTNTEAYKEMEERMSPDQIAAITEVKRLQIPVKTDDFTTATTHALKERKEKREQEEQEQ